jgi:hypothetical protein
VCKYRGAFSENLASSTLIKQFVCICEKYRNIYIGRKCTLFQAWNSKLLSVLCCLKLEFLKVA